jgi:hypothetical protein
VGDSCTVLLSEHKPGKGKNPDSTGCFFSFHPSVSIFYVVKNKITLGFTELSTRNLPRGKGQPVLKADVLTAICEPTV